MNRESTRSKATLGRRAYQEIRERILRREFSPGQRLSFRMLAKLLAMSLAPVGEALRELSRDGLVEMVPGWGARVRTMDREGTRGALLLRLAVECEAAWQCALCVQEAELEELRIMAGDLDRILAESMGHAAIPELDARFHARIAEIASPRLAEVLLANQWVLALADMGNLVARGTDGNPGDHGRIVDALASKDPEIAARTIREHIGMALTAIPSTDSTPTP
ncbi:MAG: GntR family transcriptional regulator [Planctomycetota bacterium]